MLFGVIITFAPVGTFCAVKFTLGPPVFVKAKLNASLPKLEQTVFVSSVDLNEKFEVIPVTTKENL